MSNYIFHGGLRSVPNGWTVKIVKSTHNNTPVYFNGSFLDSKVNNGHSFSGNLIIYVLQKW